MTQSDFGKIYDSYYYAHGCGEPYERSDIWLRMFDRFAEFLVRNVALGSVLDAGCALGFLVEKLRERGVEAYGVDISEYAIANVDPSIKDYCWVGSLADPLPRRYDLIVSIEVLEHMPREAADQAIINLCAASDDIIFSSTPFDYKESSHFNVRNPEAWAAAFAAQGFFRDVDFDAAFITPWAVRFRRRNEPLVRLIAEYERRFWPLWKENTDLRQLGLETRNELAGLNQQNQYLETQAERLTQQLREREQVIASQSRSLALLKAQVADKDRGLLALNKRERDLDAEILRKNEHIAYLERLLQGIENGRVMKLLRTVSARLRPAPATPEPAPAPTAALAAELPTDPYLRWIQANEPGEQDLIQQRLAARRLRTQPLFSIVTPVYNPPVQVLREAIESVIAQTYERWELCLVDGASTVAGIRELLEGYAQHDKRIRVRFLEKNLNISGNSNEALAMTSGDYVALLDHDDLLAPNMLYEVADLLNRQPELDVIYYDEDKVSEDGRTRRDPWFKPTKLSPDTLLSSNYMMHSVIRRSLMSALGGFDPEMNGAQDWDLSLRIIERTDQIGHIARVLYHWRLLPGSAAGDANAKPWAYQAQERCIAGHLQRIGVDAARVVFPSLGRVRVTWPTSGSKVSIIIPTKDKLDVLKPCLEAIFERSTYPNYEIILVDTGSIQPETQQYYKTLASQPQLKIVEFGGRFNWGAANNVGARQASGALLLFLNNDTEPLEADWIEELVRWAERPEVGVVGCKLIRPDWTIQHAGIIIGLAGHGSHLFDGDREEHYGPFGTPESYRNLMAVTGACMIMRRAVFDRLGGFDEVYRVGYSDIEFCLRAYASGLRVVYTPFARVLHHEGASRGLHVPPADVLRASLQMLPLVRQGDPYYNPNLSQNHRRPTLSSPNEERSEERLLQIIKLFGLIDPRRHGGFPDFGDESAVRSWNAIQAAPAGDQPPSVLLISHDLSLSGAPLLLYLVARYLKGHGYSVTVGAGAEGPLRARFAAAGIDVIADQAIVDDAPFAAALVRGHDLVLVNTILAWRGVHAARAVGVPCIWWLHESRFGLEVARADQSAAQAFTTADTLLFPSQVAARLYTSLADPQAIVAIHPGLDLNPSVRMPPPFFAKPGVLTAVMVGSIEPRKGQDVLLRALAELPPDLRDKIEVFIVGRILFPSFLHELEPVLKQMPNVRVVGEATPEDVAAYVQSADVYVLASRDESLPLAMLEAMGYGKAIVATDVGGVTEAISDGVQGLVVPAEDPQALAAAITRLLREPDLARQLGRAAQARFTEHFTVERFGADVLELIERHLARTALPVGEE